MKKIFVTLAAMLPLLFLLACEGGTDVVESGTYEGEIAKVVPAEEEIYVQVGDNKLELYFTETTELTRGGQAVAFDQLAEGQKVSVQVEKTGQRLDPIKVEILE